MTNAGKSDQGRRSVLLKAPQPLADGGHGGGKETRGGLDAAPLGALDEPQTMVVGVFQFTHQIEVTSGGSHEGKILRAARPESGCGKAGNPAHTAGFPLSHSHNNKPHSLPALQASHQLQTPLFAHTFQTRQGDTM
jgi:hypothetical protein